MLAFFTFVLSTLPCFVTPAANESDTVTVKTVTVQGESKRYAEDMVRSSDGTGLYTWCTLPQPGVKCPTVLTRNPYIKTVEAPAPEVLASGKTDAVRVTQHCRGRGCSEGQFVPGAVRVLEYRFADHAFRLEKGDVLRVDVSSACSAFAPHPNLSGNPYLQKDTRVARNTVIASRSRITLPCKR